MSNPEYHGYEIGGDFDYEAYDNTAYHDEHGGFEGDGGDIDDFGGGPDEYEERRPYTYRELYAVIRQRAKDKNISAYRYIGVNRTPTYDQLVETYYRHENVQRILNQSIKNSRDLTGNWPEHNSEVIEPAYRAKLSKEDGEEFGGRVANNVRRHAESVGHTYAYLNITAGKGEDAKTYKSTVDLKAGVVRGGIFKDLSLDAVFNPLLVIRGQPVEKYNLIYRTPKAKNNLPEWELGHSTSPDATLNCVIKATALQLPEDKAAQLLEEYKDLKHTEDAPAYLTINDIDELGKTKKYGLSYRIFTPIGEALRKPTITCGRNQGRVISLAATDNHAHIIATGTAQEVEYLPLDYTNKIDNCGYLEGAAPAIHAPHLTGYSKVNSRKCYGFRTVSHEMTDNQLFRKIKICKFLRPSTITGDPKHDQDPKYFNCFTPCAVFSRWFADTGDFHATPEHLKRIARIAAIPFGHRDFLTESIDSTEIDHNGSYAAYEHSPYYKGFPSGYYRTLGGPPTQENKHLVAFVECSNITPKPNYEHVYDIFRKMNPNMSVLTGPLYEFLANYCDITVIATTYAQHTKTSIISLLEQVAKNLDVSEEQKKLYLKHIRNSAIGRLIIGGLHSSTGSIHIATRSRQYAEVLINECDINNLAHTYYRHKVKDLTDSLNAPIYDHEIEVKIPEQSQAKYIHIYGYITSYSKIAILSKIIQDNLQPIAIRVDAIYVRKLPALPDSSQQLGGFKYHNKKYTPIFTNECPPPIFSTSSPPVSNPIPMHPRVVIIGPPGTAKTHSIITTAPDSSLYCVHTKIMRTKQRNDLIKARNISEEQATRSVITLQRIAFNYRRLESIKLALDDARTFGPRRKITYYHAPTTPRSAEELTLKQLEDLYREYSKKTRAIYANCTEVYLDEFAAAQFSDLQILIRVCEVKKLYLTFIGDYEQIENTLADPRLCMHLARLYNQTYVNNTADPEALQALNFLYYEDARNARCPNNSKPHRHDYEYGKFLDTLRGKSIPEQIDICLKSNRFQTSQTVPDVPLVAGTWAKISQHTATITKTHLRARNLETGERTTIPKDSEELWKTKKRMEETQPKKAKYIAAEGITVDSIQGETITHPYAIDLKTMSRHGSFYTALTRAPTPNLITLII
jgi:hypothetical protein